MALRAVSNLGGAGSFSTLTVSGATTLGGAFTCLGAMSQLGNATFGGTITTAGRADFGTGIDAGQRISTFLSNTGDRLRVYSLAAGSGVLLEVTNAAESTTARPMNIGASNGTVNLVGTTAVVTSSGLAVTGALSTTGLATLADSLRFSTDGRGSYWGGGETAIIGSAAGPLRFYVNSTETLQLTSSAATVTGTLSTTGLATVASLRINTAPTAETPSATHTVVVNLNGTNYKLLCLAA